MLKVYYCNDKCFYNSFTGKDAEDILLSHKWVESYYNKYEFNCNCGISISKISSTRVIIKDFGNNKCAICPYSTDDHTIMDVIL